MSAATASSIALFVAALSAIFAACSSDPALPMLMNRPDGGIDRDARALDARARDDATVPAADAAESDSALQEDGSIATDAAAADASDRDATAVDASAVDAIAAPDAAPPRDAGRADSGTVLPDAGPTGPSITFMVHAPAGTPYYEGVFISGGPVALGSWNGRGIALNLDPSGVWTSSVALPNGPVELKVTRGSWATVEKAADGSEIPNRQLVISGPTRAEITVARWADQPSVTGHVESLGTFHSRFLGDRPVLVYLPPSYDTDPTRRFPVLYMHDGQNLFDRRTAFQGIEWQADETAERLIRAGQIEPLIIVAIGNTAARVAEYTPTRDPGYPTGGQADQYARLIIEELKPEIDGRYRTRPDAASTGVAGSSLGGLVSMHFGLTHSDVFRRLGVISPSVWWNNRVIVTRVQALSSMRPLSIWIDIGTAEGSGTGPVADAQSLRDALVNKGWHLGGDLAYREYAGAMHNEAAWAARFGDVLRFLYPP